MDLPVDTLASLFCHEGNRLPPGDEWYKAKNQILVGCGVKRLHIFILTLTLHILFNKLYIVLHAVDYIVPL